MSKTAIVFEFNDKAGFYSILFFMLQAYIYSKQNLYSFFISHNNWYYTYCNGWHDYFTSLEEFRQEYIENYTKIIYCSHMVMPNIPDYSINKYIDALKEIYHLKPELIERAEIYIKYEIKDPNFAAIFVRRGDKISYGEAPHIEIDLIVKYIRDKEKEINKYFYNNIFVQTDDYRVIEDFRKIIASPNIIYSTVSNSKYGSHARFWKRYTQDERKKQTEEMLIGLYICIRAKICFTDYTSNVGRFLKLSNFDNVKFYMKDVLINKDIPVKNPAYGFA